MKFKRLLMAALLLIPLMFTGVEDAFARGGRSRSFGGGRSSWGSKSSSRASRTKRSTRTKSTSSWGKKKSTPKATSTRGSSSSTRRATTSKPKLSAADKKLAAKAKTQGTSFKTRKAAASDFKAKNASKYNSKYATKPTTRPTHIPQSTSVGGRNYNVTYNSQYGGYGYMGPSGTWMMYDAMADAAMVGLLMRNRGYYYPPAPIHHRPGVVYHDTGWGLGTWIGVVFFCGICCFIIVGISNRG